MVMAILRLLIRGSLVRAQEEEHKSPTHFVGLLFFSACFFTRKNRQYAIRQDRYVFIT